MDKDNTCHTELKERNVWYFFNDYFMKDQIADISGFADDEAAKASAPLCHCRVTMHGQMGMVVFQQNRILSQPADQIYPKQQCQSPSPEVQFYNMSPLCTHTPHKRKFNSIPPKSL